MRLQTYYLVQYLSMTDTKLTSLHQMMPFEWDEETNKAEIEVDWMKLDKFYCKEHLN
jgi:hypothetical protein